MDFTFDGFFSTVLGQVLIVLVSLLDDALLIGLSRLGVNIPGLQWLPYLVVGGLMAHWLHRFYHRRHSASDDISESDTPPASAAHPPAP
jgi:hypothetical protein